MLQRNISLVIVAIVAGCVATLNPVPVTYHSYTPVQQKVIPKVPQQPQTFNEKIDALDYEVKVLRDKLIEKEKQNDRSK